MKSPPTLFVSHGAPTFALEPGVAGRQLTTLGQALARPSAVLVVSAHWMTPRPRVTTSQRPRTIHDFGGFDQALYEIGYPAVGHPALAERAIRVLRASGWAAEADDARGLDHGAWVPLLHLYPKADVPVLQVSMPVRLDAESAFALGRTLAPLSAQGALRGLSWEIVASGLQSPNAPLDGRVVGALGRLGHGGAHRVEAHVGEEGQRHARLGSFSCETRGRGV